MVSRVTWLALYKAFWPKVRHALPWARVPCQPGRYRLSAALAAPQALAGLGTVRVSGRASTLTSAERAADADPLLCAGRMGL